MKCARSFSHEPMTIEDRLRFLVRFARTDLETLRHGDWLNLAEDVGAFLQNMVFPGGDIALPPGAPHRLRPILSVPADLHDAFKTLETFQGLMREVQPVVREGLERLTVELDATGGLVQSSLLRPHAWKPLPAVDTHACPLFFAVRGPVRELFCWHMQRLAVDAPIGKLAHCRECHAIFFRVKQQVHCSRACTNRVSQRRFRERHEAEAAATA